MALVSLCAILFLWGAVLAAESRLTLSPYFDFSFSDNIFWDRSRVGDTILSPGVSLDLSANSWNFFLNADGRIYQKNDYLNSALVSGGATFIKVFSSRTSLFVSPEFSLTRYGGSISFLNTATPGIAIGLKHALSDQVSGRLGVGLRYSDYLNEDSYDRYRLAAFLELNAFFRTQSSVRLTLGMNYQLFPHIAIQVAAPAAFPAALAGGLDPGSGTGSSYHRGVPAPGQPGPGSIPPVAEPQVDGTATVIDLSIPQPYATIRIAQGIGYKTGFVAEFMVRKSLAPLEGIQAIAASEWALEQTDEDFFWEGGRLSLGIKTEALLGLEISVDLSFFKKEYPGIVALDLDGVTIQPPSYRSDTLAHANVRMAKRLRSLILFVRGGYRKNHSNDLYFQYDFLTISAGMDLAI